MSTRTAFPASTAELAVTAMLSTVDPEMRHGRKSQHQRFDGYKLHAAATNAAEPLDHGDRGRAGERAGRSRKRER